MSIKESFKKHLEKLGECVNAAALNLERIAVIWESVWHIRGIFWDQKGAVRGYLGSDIQG